MLKGLLRSWISNTPEGVSDQETLQKYQKSVCPAGGSAGPEADQEGILFKRPKKDHYFRLNIFNRISGTHEYFRSFLGLN